jgi:hypothetical protein
MFRKNLFQTPKSNQNEGNDFENDEIQMEVCCPSGKERNVPDSISPIHFKNDSVCPISSRDFSTLGNKSIMSLISIDSESHSSISFPLFHGKLLRFMCGIRNFGQVLDGTSEKGFFDPLKSRVNCAQSPYFKYFKI